MPLLTRIRDAIAPVLTREQKAAAAAAAAEQRQARSFGELAAKVASGSRLTIDDLKRVDELGKTAAEVEGEALRVLARQQLIAAEVEGENLAGQHHEELKRWQAERERARAAEGAIPPALESYVSEFKGREQQTARKRKRGSEAARVQAELAGLDSADVREWLEGQAPEWLREELREKADEELEAQQRAELEATDPRHYFRAVAEGRRKESKRDLPDLGLAGAAESTLEDLRLEGAIVAGFGARKAESRELKEQIEGLKDERQAADRKLAETILAAFEEHREATEGLSSREVKAEATKGRMNQELWDVRRSWDRRGSQSPRGWIEVAPDWLKAFVGAK